MSRETPPARRRRADAPRARRAESRARSGGFEHPTRRFERRKRPARRRFPAETISGVEILVAVRGRAAIPQVAGWDETRPGLWVDRRRENAGETLTLLAARSRCPRGLP